MSGDEHVVEEYLGDGVYFHYDAEIASVELTTANGVTVTNKIYLDQDTVIALLRTLTKVYDREALIAALTRPNGGN